MINKRQRGSEYEELAAKYLISKDTGFLSAIILTERVR